MADVAGPWTQYGAAANRVAPAVPPMEPPTQEQDAGPWSRYNPGGGPEQVPSATPSGVSFQNADRIPDTVLQPRADGDVRSIDRYGQQGFTEALRRVGDGVILRNPETQKLVLVDPSISLSDTPKNQALIKEMLSGGDMSALRRDSARTTLNMPGSGALRRGGLAANLLAGIPGIGSYTDEAIGAAAGLVGGEGAAETATERARDMRSLYETAYPAQALGAKIGGGVAGSAAALAAAPSALTSGAATRFAALPGWQKLGLGAAASSALGGTEGTIYGYGEGGEEGGPTRGEAALSHGVTGAAVGAPLSVVSQLALPAGRAVFGLGRNLIGKRKQTDAAADIVLNTLRRSGDDRTLKQLGSEMRQNPAAGLIGADTPVPALAPAVASTTRLDSQAAQAMREAQDTYGAGVRGRMSNQLRETLSVPQRTTPEEMATSIKDRTQKQFQRTFQDFDDVPLTDEARDLLRSADEAGLAGEMRRVSQARATLQGAPRPSQFYPEYPRSTPASRFGDADTVTPSSTVSGLLREGEQLRAGGRLSPNQADYLEELEPSLENLVTGLGPARREFGAGMRASEAVAEGRRAASGGVDPYRVRAEYAGVERSGAPRLNPAGRQAYRLGLAGELENVATRSDPGAELGRRLDRGTLQDVMRETEVPESSVGALRDFAERESRGRANLRAATPPTVGSGISWQDITDAGRRGAYMQLAGALIAGATDLASKGSARIFAGLTAEGRRELARITTSTDPADVVKILQDRLTARDRAKLWDTMVSAGATGAGLFTAREVTGE